MTTSTAVTVSVANAAASGPWWPLASMKEAGPL